MAGLTGLVMALNLCRHVDAYGFALRRHESSKHYCACRASPATGSVPRLQLGSAPCFDDYRIDRTDATRTEAANFFRVQA
jgi:hypothetical protein